MNFILFEPHHDDAVLFASYTLIKENPLVVTVLSHTDHMERWEESNDAMDMLGVGWMPLPFPEKNPDWDEVRERISQFKNRKDYDHFFAPAVEENGHEQHSLLGEIVADVFGAERVTHYLTYRRGCGRSQSENEVIAEPGWAAQKFSAMACHASQIERENTRYWFSSDNMLREWLQ